MRWYFLVAIAIAVTLALTRALQMVGATRDRRNHPLLGRLVGRDGRRFHIRLAGSAAGAAVVIEQGAGGFGALWWPLQDAVAAFATVATYDG